MQVRDYVPSGGLGVALLYKGVQISDQQIDLLAERARDRRTVILYDEIDQEEDGTWVHRLLFGPVGEMSVWFSSSKLSRARRSDRGFVGYDPFSIAD